MRPCTSDGRPSPSCSTTRASSRTQITVSSFLTWRYSIANGSPVRSARSDASSTRSRSSGWIWRIHRPGSAFHSSTEKPRIGSTCGLTYGGGSDAGRLPRVPGVGDGRHLLDQRLEPSFGRHASGGLEPRTCATAGSRRAPSPTAASTKPARISSCWPGSRSRDPSVERLERVRPGAEPEQAGDGERDPQQISQRRPAPRLLVRPDINENPGTAIGRHGGAPEVGRAQPKARAGHSRRPEPRSGRAPACGRRSFRGRA